MSKFKVGDTVRRVSDNARVLPVGCVGIVTKVSSTNNPDRICIDNDAFGYYDADNFELVQAASEQPAVLTPLEVFQCILEGTPLEYSIKKLSGERTWHTVTNPKHIDLEDIECAEYRKKPPTVLINGISVPAPAKAFTEEGYGVNLLRNEVFKRGTNLQYAGVSWSTEAEAQEVLDAIMTSFSK